VPSSLRGGAGCGGNVKKARALRGAPIAVEEKPLKGEAQGCSGAQAPEGLAVEVAQGVAKPRTRHSTAEGSAVGKRICQSETVS
jgi:hypothetical protein